MAEDAAPQKCDLKSVHGRVVSVDWVGSILVIDTRGDELSLVVTQDTKFKKGTSEIYFAEVNQSDNVYVRYYDCGFAGLKAMEVNVTNA
jgi:hypothetical protein